MTRAYTVVDADGHILEPLDLWDKYMDPGFHERRPRFENREGEGYPRGRCDVRPAALETLDLLDELVAHRGYALCLSSHH